MAVPLSNYVEIKDNYCIAYLGGDQHTVDELINNRTKLEKLYPGIHVYICFQDKLLQHPASQFFIPISRLDKSKFAFIREINEAEEILQESGLGA